jgi:hypothetical protein
MHSPATLLYWFGAIDGEMMKTIAGLETHQAFQQALDHSRKSVRDLSVADEEYRRQRTGGVSHR